MNIQLAIDMVIVSLEHSEFSILEMMTELHPSIRIRKDKSGDEIDTVDELDICFFPKSRGSREFLYGISHGPEFKRRHFGMEFVSDEAIACLIDHDGFYEDYCSFMKDSRIEQRENLLKLINM